MMSLIPAWISSIILTTTFLIAATTSFVFYRVSRTFVGAKERLPWMIIVFLTVWVWISIMLGWQGFFKPDPAVHFPRIVFLFIPIILGVLALNFSKNFRRTIDAILPVWIIGIQFYRILGTLFLVLYAQGLLPKAFALPVGIGDIAVGVTAPLVAYLYFVKHPWAHGLAIIWNVFGIGDLVVAVTTGFLSSPGPFQRLAFDSPNVLVGQFPLILIPIFAVPLSILFHVFSLKVLIKSSAS